MRATLTTALAAALLLSACPAAPPLEITGGDAYPAGALQTFPGLVVVPNLDDDNDEDGDDWGEKGAAEDDDDRAWFTVAAEHFEALKKNQSLSMEMGGSAGDFRVYLGGRQVLGDTSDGPLLSYALETGEDAQVFTVEAQESLSVATVSIFKLDKDGEKIESDTIWMIGSPLILNHHLQQTEHVWVIDLSSGPSNFSNAHMVETYEDVLGEQFTAFPPAPYFNDVWIQDEIQFGTMYGPDQRLDVVIDSIRDRGLIGWAEDFFPDEDDVIIGVWGDGSPANSLDSFGNLEISPPVTADGVHYPNGRVYWGGDSSYHPAEEMTDHLADQLLQEPFRTDTSWLCVGHIDEYTSFVPDPTAPRGFRFIYADVDAAWDVFDEMDGSLSLPRYNSGHGFPTVSSMTNSNALVALNEEIQEDYLDPGLELFTEELDLAPEEILLLPSLFEEPPGCGQYLAALVPGMVNLFVTNRGDQTDVFLADPFLRNGTSSDDGQDDDAMIEAVIDLMPDTLDLHFVDNWSVYHLGLGEVHCGSNSTRTPVDEWWLSAQTPLQEVID